MTTEGLFKTGFALLGAAVVIDTVKKIVRKKDEKTPDPKKVKREGYGLW